MNTTQIITEVIGKCTAGHVVTGMWSDTRSGWITCPCGKHAMARTLKVTMKPEMVCADKCMSATGPSCSCSCGGKRHGRNHAAA